MGLLGHHGYWGYDPVVKHDVDGIIKAGQKISGFLIDTQQSIIEYHITDDDIFITYKFEPDV